jgi:uncharacterized protein YqcC (DUF446 family)
LSGHENGDVDSRHVDLSALLADIEGEMRARRMWSDEPPAPAAMASRMPFCYDTLPLAAWLQWVLLPRLRLVIERDDPLPLASDIWPLAQHEFQKLGRDAGKLLQLIRQLDELISGD